MLLCGHIITFKINKSNIFPADPPICTKPYFLILTATRMFHIQTIR